MGFLENLKDKASELADKAKEGLESAKDHAADLADDVRDRFDGDGAPGEPLGDVVEEPLGAADEGSTMTAAPSAADLEAVEPQVADGDGPPVTYGDANVEDVLGTVEDRRPDPDPI